MKKTIFIFAFASFLLSTILVAQNFSSGEINYEGMHKINPSNMKLMINGQEIKPGSADAPQDLPEVVTYDLQLLFTESYAKEERETEGPMIRSIGGPGVVGPASKPLPLGPPFVERKYIDLAAKKHIKELEVKKDGQTKVYFTEELFTKADKWKESDKTKKIGGLVCRKATCPWKGENYTIWYTTDLNFTYSPIKDLTPEKGVVLQIEGSEESYKATNIKFKTIEATRMKPSAQAEKVTQEQMREIQEKAMADHRQQLFEADN